MAAHSRIHPGEGCEAGFATSFTSAGLVGIPIPASRKRRKMVKLRSLRVASAF